MTTRKYSSRAQQTTLSSGITSGDTTMTVGSGSNLMGGKTPAVGETYTVVIDPDTALEEIVDVSNYASGNTLTIARGIDGSTGVAHSAGAIVRHMVIGRDLSEANTHIENTTTAHGITLANIVQTGSTGTVTSAMILDGTIVNADVNASAAIAYSKLSLAGAITSADIANDTIVNADINTAAGIALSKLATDPLARANHTGTQLAATISNFDTQVRTNRLDQMAAPTAAVPLNAQKLTGVADPTLAQDASTKAYVDAQITALVGGAPGTLDTLDEIAAAINDSGSFATSVVLRDGTQAMTGALAMGTNKITGLGTPTVSTDAATKAYADSIVATSPGNLTGPITSVGAATSIASQTGTGTKFVVDTSPTLVTPVLGVATATSINGTTIPSTKTLVVTTDKLSVHAATTSAELAGVISDETGTGALVFATSPTLVTPVLGTPTSVNLANATFPSTIATLTGTQTLTNKTLTSPVLTTPTISTVDAKGDLLVGTADNTVDRLAVGNNGETLVADSSTSTGLRYQGNFAAGKNAILNGDFGIWQRGTSFNPSSTGFFMFADRWRSYAYSASATTATQQAFTPGTAPVAGYEGTYFGRVVSTNTFAYFSYNGIENVRTYAGQTVTLSYYAKSASAQTLNEVQVSQYFGATGSAAVATTLTAPAITTSWVRYTHTFTMPSISGKTISGGNDTVYINIKGAINNALDIWGVQLEAGSVATAFQTATGTIQGELAACQRYYYQPTAGVYFNGQVVTTTTYYVMVYFPVAMRVAPSITNTSIVAGLFPATASSAAFAGTTSFANTRTANGTGAGGFADTYTASAEL